MKSLSLSRLSSESYFQNQNREMSSEVDSNSSARVSNNHNLWSAADRGDTQRVRAIIFPENEGDSGKYQSIFNDSSNKT